MGGHEDYVVRNHLEWSDEGRPRATAVPQLLWVQRFDTVEARRAALEAWRQLYNTRWLIERHGHRSPAQVRQELLTATGREAA